MIQTTMAREKPPYLLEDSKESVTNVAGMDIKHMIAEVETTMTVETTVEITTIADQRNSMVNGTTAERRDI